MKILICDDDPEYTQSIAQQVSQQLALRKLSHEIEISSHPRQIADSDDVYDMAFLDIQMPEMDGITLAHRLKERNGRMALFFITNFEEYQDDAMDLHAFRFFEKPINPERLSSGLEKALEYIDGAYVDIFLNAAGSQQRILADDILYLTRLGRKTTVITSSETLTAADGFDDLCARLPQSFFYAVHKSFFVNLHYVNKYSYSEIYLTDGTRIPVAPRKQTDFRKFWFAYLRRR